MKVQKLSVIYSGDSFPADENAMVLANHQGLTDVFFILDVANQRNRLRDTKWFAKDVLKYVPGIGWGMMFLDFIFLKRNWTKDQASIEATFKNFTRDRVPAWVVSFLEGTRKTPKKLLRSQEYARKLGEPPFENLLYPRTKGFVASIQGMRGHLHAVYDFTIGFEGEPVSLMDVLIGRVRTVHVHLRRFPIEQLPKDPDGLAKWAIQLYREKDTLLTSFKKNGYTFPGERTPAGILNTAGSTLYAKKSY